MIVIRVKPTPEKRRAFAEWATQQRPKVRTLSSTSFAVPPAAFQDIPEELLIGSMVDGHRYVSPDEDAAAPAVAPLAFTDVVEIGTDEEVGEALPALPDEAYAPDAVALDASPMPELTDGEETAQAAEDAAGDHQCEDCGRPYATERGLAGHRRQKHPEGA
ncbi:hypothetical protein OV450_1359 [Actinobacteria bacterium OV450]|nr:hypothetical protein OV450_1359 [Actinobacteria bacterium OV450]